MNNFSLVKKYFDILSGDLIRQKYPRKLSDTGVSQDYRDGWNDRSQMIIDGFIPFVLKDLDYYENKEEDKIQSMEEVSIQGFKRPIPSFGDDRKQGWNDCLDRIEACECKIVRKK